MDSFLLATLITSFQAIPQSSCRADPSHLSWQSSKRTRSFSCHNSACHISTAQDKECLCLTKTLRLLSHARENTVPLAWRKPLFSANAKLCVCLHEVIPSWSRQEDTLVEITQGTTAEESGDLIESLTLLLVSLLCGLEQHFEL